MTTLAAHHLSKSYGKRPVVKDVSFSVKRGEVVGLLGPNGAGKTTCFYMTIGLVRQDGGQITIDDKNISELPMHGRARQGLGYLPQEPSIFRKLNVADNILAILETRRDLNPEQRQEKLNSLLNEFHITHLTKSLGMSLSGGERRRVEIARALASNPKFLLLDEPFAGIDPIAIEEVKSTVALLKKMNIGIIITDHNVKEALSIVDYGFIIYNGEIIKSGTPKEITSDKFVKKIYLGQNYQ